MARKILFIAMTVAIGTLWLFVEQAAAVEGGPEYRSYVHNYPHQVPSDYVYRTERVFAPPAQTSPFALMMGGNDAKEAAGKTAEPGGGTVMQERVRDLVRQLLENTVEEIRDNYVVAVGTFVNMSQLYATSSLGRFVSEQLITELQKSGVEVIEVRKTPSLIMSSNDGVFGLSTDMDELSLVHNAQAIVVGTYSAAGGEVFINARLLRNSDNMVLSTGSMTYAMDAMSRAMLADEGMPIRTGKPVAVRAFVENK